MQRGEIYWLPFGDPIPKIDEKTGQGFLDEDGQPELEQKRRPIIVVSRDHLNDGKYVVVVPCYSQQIPRRKRFPQNVLFQAGEGNLPTECLARTDQVTYVDKKLIDWKHDRIGRADAAMMGRIVKAIRWTIRDDELEQ